MKLLSVQKVQSVALVMSNGKIRKYYRLVGLFECPACGKVIKRKVSSGVAQKRCACRPHTLGHGLSKHPLYRVLTGIKQRCGNPNNSEYKRYGARGITLCKEWKNGPARFIRWAIANGWKPGLQIDRRNNHRGYSPKNCRFTTPEVNSQNSRNSKLTPHDVMEIRRLYIPNAKKLKLAKQFGVCHVTIQDAALGKTWKNIPP